ncbi:alcohol dehydrogenase catalytic domain-containing protein [Cupriavidus basilensis]
MTTASIPMAAIAFRRGSTLTDPDCLTDIDAERPEPGPHDLRVAVRAVSVNPVDTKIQAGLVAAPDGVRSLGWDAAGVVEAIGEAVTLFRPGEAVYYAGSFDRQRQQCTAAPGGRTHRRPHARDLELCRGGGAAANLADGLATAVRPSGRAARQAGRCR